MDFMSQKSFHPQNKWTMRKIWIAEQKAEENKKNQEQTKKEFESEQEFWKNKTMVGYSEKELSKMKERHSLGFMYMEPPGLKALAEKEEKEEKKEDQEEDRKPEDPYVTLFKNAPMEGKYAENIKVHHQPFGVEVKNVRCLRCKMMGHSSGDKICPLNNVNPNDEFRQNIEDPLRLIGGMSSQSHGEDRLILKSSQSKYGGEERNHDIISSPQQSDEDEDDPLKGLSKKERQFLMKKYKDLKKKARKEEKRKRRKHHHDSHEHKERHKHKRSRDKR